MAATAAVPLLHSAVLGTDSLWAEPDPDYPSFCAAYAAARTHSEASGIIHDFGVCSPVAVAFQLASDADHIYIGHTPGRYPSRIGVNSAFNGATVFLVGDKDSDVVPYAVPTDAFRMTGAVRAHELATLTTDTALWGAATPVFRSGPHAATDPHTTAVDVRRVMLVPCDKAAQVVDAAGADGRFDLRAFYEYLIEPELSGTPEQAARIEPLADWFRVACTEATATINIPLGLTPLVGLDVPTTSQFYQWVESHRAHSMAKIGAIGPGLTSAAFDAGVTRITRSMETATQDSIAHDNAMRTKTFEDKYGRPLLELMKRLTDSATENDLPAVHRLLINNPKANGYSLINASLQERALSSTIPLSPHSSPLVTTKIMDEVFRQHQPGGTGQTFGTGLTPFAVICEGHKESAEASKLVREATIAESGSTVSLSDVRYLTSSDVRFPTLPHVAVEKLYGWSIFVDLFHGVGHPISVSIRNAVLAIGPLLPRLHSEYTENPAIGMDLICRVLYDMQQTYFQWLRTRRDTDSIIVVPVPSFHEVIGKVQSFRTESLSRLPERWYSMMSAPRSEARSDTGARARAGTVAVSYAKADSKLLKRFENSRFTSVTEMLNEGNGTAPKHNGEDVCLTWALKGSCTSKCKRSGSHVTYPASVNKKLHALLDGCGVEPHDG